MAIRLSDHFTYGKLLRFTLPSIVMMIISSLYSVVDGLFVSNFVGDLALSAVNIVFPVVMIVGSVGFMLGAGGSAIVAKTLGEGKEDLANRYFSMIISGVLIAGALVSVICVIFIESIVRFAGASDLLLSDCIAYGRIMLGGVTAFMLQVSFLNFFVVAEKPHFGLFMSLGAGGTNIFLDYLFIVVLKMGIAGAGLATVLGYCVGGIIPLLYFLFVKKEGLRLVRPGFYPRQLLHAVTNGSSEMMSNVSASVVGILYNLQLMRIIGETGVAAYSVMMYVDFVFVAAFLGYSMGSAPVVSYHYGAENVQELKNVFKRSMRIILTAALAMVGLSELLSYPLAYAFVGYDRQLMEMTVHGFRIFALCYLFCGMNIYASAFFTALCNGVISACISFIRSLLFRGGMVLLMPALFGLDGIWMAVVVAEGAGVVVSWSFFLLNRKKYRYL